MQCMVSVASMETTESVVSKTFAGERRLSDFDSFGLG